MVPDDLHVDGRKQHTLCHKRHGGSYSWVMDPIPLHQGAPYRLTFPGGLVLESKFEIQVGQYLIFRRLEVDPMLGHPVAHAFQWHEIKGIEQGEWVEEE